MPLYRSSNGGVVYFDGPSGEWRMALKSDKEEALRNDVVWIKQNPIKNYSIYTLYAYNMVPESARICNMTILREFIEL